MCLVYPESSPSLVVMPCLLASVDQAGFQNSVLLPDWLKYLGVNLKTTNQVVLRQLNLPLLFKITNVSNLKLQELTVWMISKTTWRNCCSVRLSKSSLIGSFFKPSHWLFLKAHSRTGIDGKQTTFLFGDQQIKDEAFLEDISALLR